MRLEVRTSLCREGLLKDVLMYICRRDASNIYRVNTGPFSNPQGIAINFPMTSRENYPVACLPSKVVR
jgi:hypothetical protein